MVADVRMATVQHTEIIGVLGQIGKQRGDRKAALAVLGKLPRRLKILAARAELLAVPPAEPGLVVEGIDLRRTTAHEQENYPFGPGRKVRLTRRQWIIHSGHQPTQGQPTKPAGRTLQCVSSVQQRQSLIQRAAIMDVAS